MNDFYISAPKKQRVFVDLDGTLAEFRTECTFDDLYKKNYFYSLKPQKNVVEMIKSLLSEENNLDIYILSAYLDDSPYAKEEKLAWINKYLPELDNDHIILCINGSCKTDSIPNGIKNTDILIDDYTKNLKAWNNAGGIAIKLMNGINGSNGTWKDINISAIYMLNNEQIPVSFMNLRKQLLCEVNKNNNL